MGAFIYLPVVNCFLTLKRGFKEQKIFSTNEEGFAYSAIVPAEFFVC